MALQKTFKESYANRLQYEAKHGISIERYSKPEFTYDKGQVLIIPTLEQPKGLLERMDAKDDLKSAKALYEAYVKLTPLQASDESFWTYLTHADLFPYVQQRNNAVLEEGFNDAKYIDNYFFHGNGGLIYHPLAGLWWDVHCTIDNDSVYPYKYTDYLFRDYGLRVTYMGRYALFRHKEQVFGILQFLMDNEDVASEHFRQRSRWISQYFNKVGAVKQLRSLSRDFFYSELERLKDVILRIKTDEDVKNDSLTADKTVSLVQDAEVKESPTEVKESVESFESTLPSDTYIIRNSGWGCCLINSNRHVVYSSSGKIANVSGLYFRVNYTYSRITMTLIEKQSNDEYVARKDVLSAKYQSQLYKLLDPKSYIEQLEEIKPSKNNPEEFVIKVSGVWFDHAGNKVEALNHQSFPLYCERIANIKQAKIHGEIILAKPVLLLALLDGVREMLFRNNRFVLNEWLKKHYESLMRKYTKQSIFDNITPINNPFWHLQSDGFWHLHYNGAQPTIINTPSVRWLEDNVNYASFDDDLWTLLQDRTSRQQLREFIVEHKLPKVK